MSTVTVTIVGNLTDDPSLRFTKNGVPVANFTVASTPREKRDGQWVDGETVFLRCTAWKRLAENVAESVSKGQQVIVTGQLQARSFETRDGEKRTNLEVDVADVGVGLAFKPVGGSSSGGSSDPWGQSGAPF